MTERKRNQPAPPKQFVAVACNRCNATREDRRPCGRCRCPEFRIVSRQLALPIG